jgi:hypothetical protein
MNAIPRREILADCLMFGYSGDDTAIVNQLAYRYPKVSRATLRRLLKRSRKMR